MSQFQRTNNNANIKKRNSYSDLSRSRSKERLNTSQSRVPSYALRRQNLQKYTPKISKINIPSTSPNPRGYYDGQENNLGEDSRQNRLKTNFPRFRSEDERSVERKAGDKSLDTKTKRKAKLIYSRFDEFMKNLQLKKYQAAQGSDRMFVGYGTNDEDTDEPINERNLQALNAPLREYVNSNNKAFPQVERVSRESESPKKSVSPKREVEKLPARQNSYLNPASSDDGSSSRSFRQKSRFQTEITQSTFETKTMINVELEVEFLKLKKEIMLLEEKVKSKDREVDGLQMLLEGANTEILKIHHAREKDFERIQQLENDILQQKRINKNLEQEMLLHPGTETLENGNMIGEAYQIVRILKQDRALLRKRLEQYESELEEQKQRNQALLKDFNENFVNKSEKQGVFNGKELEVLLSKYMGELDALRNIHKKGNRKLEEFLNELEERELMFERDLEEERKKVSDVLREIDKITQEKIAAEAMVQNMQAEQKKKTELFKVQTEKINDVLNELARENKHYKSQIKILAADKPIRDKLESLESHYKKQAQTLLREKDEARNKSKGGSNEDSHDASNHNSPSNRYVVRKNSVGEKETMASNKKSGGTSEEEDKARREEIMRLSKQLEEAQVNFSSLNKKKDELNEENAKLKEKVKTLEQDKKAVKSDLDKIKTKTIGAIGEYEEKLAKAVENVEKLKKENELLKTNKGSATLINELKFQNEKLKGDINNLEIQLKEKFTEMQQQALENEERIASIDAKSAQITAQKAKLEEKLEEDAKVSQGEIESREKTISQLQEQLKEVEEKYKSLMELYSKEDDLREELNRHKTIVEKQKEMLAKVREENKELEELFKESGEKLEELDNQRSEINKKSREQDEIIQAYEKQMEMWSMQIAEANTKEQDLLKQIKTLKEKLGSK